MASTEDEAATLQRRLDTVHQRCDQQRSVFETHKDRLTALLDPGACDAGNTSPGEMPIKQQDNQSEYAEDDESFDDPPTSIYSIGKSSKQASRYYSVQEATDPTVRSMVELEVCDSRFPNIVCINGKVVAICCFMDGYYMNATLRNGPKYLNGLSGLLQHVIQFHKRKVVNGVQEIAQICRKTDLDDIDTARMLRGEGPLAPADYILRNIKGTRTIEMPYTPPPHQ